MAHYENLPVYKAALDLAIYFEKMVQFFTRYHKYTIGTDLRNASRRILVLVAKANIKQDRAEALLEALEKLDELKILVKLCKEIKGFRSFKSFEFATKLIVGVSKQCEGWVLSEFSTVKDDIRRINLMTSFKGFMSKVVFKSHEHTRAVIVFFTAMMNRLTSKKITAYKFLNNKSMLHHIASIVFIRVFKASNKDISGFSVSATSIPSWAFFSANCETDSLPRFWAMRFPQIPRMFAIKRVALASASNFITFYGAISLKLIPLKYAKKFIFASLTNAQISVSHIYLQIKRAAFGGLKGTVKSLHLLTAHILDKINLSPSSTYSISHCGELSI